MAAAALGFHPVQPVSADVGAYQQTNLVSDLPNLALFQDPDLVNPWGIVAGPTTPFWVSDNGAGVSTLYNGDGTKRALTVSIPGPGGGSGTPTGVVFARGSGFTLTSGGVSGDSFFIFATEDGTIAAWSPFVDPTNAVTTVDNSMVPTSQDGAVYKGLALAASGGSNFLYATNFRAGTVDVFDTAFTQVHQAGAFSDPEIPGGYAPFGIAAVPVGLLVTYAKQDAARHDDVAGQGHGFVDLYSTSGTLLQHLIEHGQLNSPWGIAIAPASGFGQFSGDLLVGDFGDGTINAYQLSDGEFLGKLRGANRHPLVIDGLWGLRFGNGAAAGPTTTLFFTAGINGEADGLFGSIAAS